MEPDSVIEDKTIELMTSLKGSAPIHSGLVDLKYKILSSWASMVAQMVKNLPALQETWVRSLG